MNSNRIIGRPNLVAGELTVVVVFGLLGIATVHADDWPQWGGPRRDIVWRETGIVKVLPTTGLLPRVWSKPIGEGYSGPAVANGRVYVMDRVKSEGTERVLCFNAADGKILWQHAYRVQYTVDYPAGPRMTPLVDEGRLYTIGTMGHMFCFDADSGSIIWQKNFVDDYDTRIPT